MAHAVRRHIATRCTPGTLIAGQIGRARTVADLASRLDAPTYWVHRALSALEREGAVATMPMAGVLVLGPGQPHPADADLQRTIRDRVAAGFYPAGSALPTGLLGDEFGLDAPQVARACRYLTHDDTLIHHHGPHGPGFYVQAPTSLEAAS
ncbi:hypothetical protein CP968_32030 [Streptomyces subrutilus]|uniref:Uncharacterized protein n=1 Tax=Streptomyces subrutilus TaxID=36818 RepID=A0A5P2USG5_9ACTN|nr:hypothetical protein CP968_32030 [Streptomyces subrutilus]